MLLWISLLLLVAYQPGSAMSLIPPATNLKITASAPVPEKAKSGFFARLKNSFHHSVAKLKKVFQEGRPRLKAGAFLLGFILGPLAFLFFIKNHEQSFRYSVKVGFIVWCILLVGVLIGFVLI